MERIKDDLQGSGTKGRCVPVEVSHSRGSLEVARGIASTTSGEVGEDCKERTCKVYGGWLTREKSIGLNSGRASATTLSSPHM